MGTKDERHDIKRRYGITLEQYNALLEAQQGKCGICGRYRKLSIDHCHTRKQVRGLLCSNCNTGLGMFEENITVLRAAIAYAERHGG